MKQFCKCGRLLAVADWPAHLQTCPVMRKVLEATPRRNVDVRYPDLAVLRRPLLECDALFMRAGIPTFELPASAKLVDGRVDVMMARHAPSWAVVIVAQAVTSDVATRALRTCMEDGEEAIKALITLLRLAPDKDYARAINTFVGESEASSFEHEFAEVESA